MDIAKLITKQTYLIPKQKEELASAVYDELNKENLFKTKRHEIVKWKVDSSRPRSFSFFHNLVHAHIADNLVLGEDTDSAIERLTTELRKLKAKEATDAIYKNLDNCSPHKIIVDIISTEENGYRINVECFPILYFNITKYKVTNFDDIDIQDANLVSERFLKEIFVNGLNGTLVSEGQLKSVICEEETALLINDVRTHQISKKIEEALDSATSDILIMAWMGTIHLSKLRELKEKGVSIKVITGLVKEIRQDVMQKEKEKAFEELISIIGKQNICVKRDFHGRAIVIDNKVFVGSMDLDSYSLTGARTETTIYTQKIECVRAMRNYFNRIFEPLSDKPTCSNTNIKCDNE